MGGDAMKRYLGRILDQKAATKPQGGMSRREMMRLTAAATISSTVVSSTGFAWQTNSAQGGRGRAEQGTGVPVVTKVIKTAYGPVQGLVIDGVHSFRGLRYAAAPIGLLRWMPPQKPAPWTTVQD